MRRIFLDAARLAAMVGGAVLAPAACGVATALEEPAPVYVKAAVVQKAFIPDEVSGFGSLSFVRKVDVASPQDALIGTLPYREGDAVRYGAVIARLINPQIVLAVGRAENGVAQAQAALDLAAARLFEGQLAAESRLMGIKKSMLELVQARRELTEAERKQSDQETLLRAGGIPEESARSGRFSLQSARESLTLMEMDVGIRRVGMRAEDLTARGLAVPEDEAGFERAVTGLSVAALSAERDAAAARLDAARTELESARLSLAELTVTSPLEGVVAARYLEEGERVQREDKLVTVMATGSWYAVAAVSETDALRLSAGMAARVTVDGAAADFDGTVELVSPVADSGTASFTVRVVLHDTSGRLKPGMFARVTVTAGPGRNALVVPESALTDRRGQSATLYVVAGGTVSERGVELGESIETGRIVTTGAVEGEVVVDKPDAALKEGERVSVSD